MSKKQENWTYYHDQEEVLFALTNALGIKKHEFII